MFKFFKDKIKGVLSKFSKKVEEEAPAVEVEKEVEVLPVEEKVEKELPPGEERKPVLEKIKAVEKEPAEEIVKEEPEKRVELEKIEVPAKEVEEKLPEKKVKVVIPEKKIEVKEKRVIEEKREELLEEEAEVPGVKPEEPREGLFKKLFRKEKPKIEERPREIPEEKRGLFRKITETITTKKLSSEKFDELFWDLELALLENNVAVEVIEKIKEDLKQDLVDRPIPRGRVSETIASSLHDSVEGLFTAAPIDLLSLARKKRPFVVCFVGINGSGKTTTIAKVAKFLKDNGLSVVIAAADTFRAAAIDQLQVHADNLGVKLIKHDYGSDPAAVAFDAVKHAEKMNKDVVLIDTAGRLHSDVNLMDEMKKIVRVAHPDLKLFVGESITGNDCVEQAKRFDEAVGIDGVVLAKADVDEKGGAAVSISYVTKKPIVFLGIGQDYQDLEVFDKNSLIASMGI